MLKTLLSDFRAASQRTMAEAQVTRMVCRAARLYILASTKDSNTEVGVQQDMSVECFEPVSPLREQQDRW